RWVRAEQGDMAEIGDAHVAGGKEARATVIGTRKDLDLVAAWIGGCDDRPGAPAVAFFPRADMHRPSGLFQGRADRIEVIRVDQFQADRLIGGIAFEIHQGMVAGVAAHIGLVAAEIGGVAFARDQLQPDDGGGELDSGVQVLCAKPDITDVVQIDHRTPLLRTLPRLAGPRSAVPRAVFWPALTATGAGICTRRFCRLAAARRCGDPQGHFGSAGFTGIEITKDDSPPETRAIRCVSVTTSSTPSA